MKYLRLLQNTKTPYSPIISGGSIRGSPELGLFSGRMYQESMGESRENGVLQFVELLDTFAKHRTKHVDIVRLFR
jgi:hypothetical protein